MSFRRLLVPALAVSACQGDRDPAPPVARPVIEATVAGTAVASVTPGEPCRAVIHTGAGNVELQVGGPPLVAMVGDVRWTAEAAGNGTTFRKNDEPVARIHANQLFDAQGIPLLKVTEDGSVVSGPGRVVRKAVAIAGHSPKVEIKPVAAGEEAVVTNTEDVVLAVMLAAPEAEPTIKGLVACHLLQARGT